MDAHHDIVCLLELSLLHFPPMLLSCFRAQLILLYDHFKICSECVSEIAFFLEKLCDSYVKYLLINLKTLQCTSNCSIVDKVSCSGVLM